MRRMGRAEAAAELDSVVEMLTAAALEGAALADDETHARHGEATRLCLQQFEARCALVRLELERTVRERAVATVRTYELPQLASSDVDRRLPTLTLPPRKVRNPAAGGLDAARRDASANLGVLAAPLDGDAAWDQVLQWLENAAGPNTKTNDAATMLLLSSVERVFYTWAEKLRQGLTIPHLDHVALKEVVYHYRSVASAFRKTPAAQAQLTSELRSRETLLAWISFCLVYKAAVAGCAELAGYAPALDPSDLRHLVLSDKSAVDAALRVAAYLQQMRATGTPPVFSLRARDGTFDFGWDYARRHLSLEWATEKASAESRKARHWDQVQSQKKALCKLDSELAALGQQLAIAEAELQRLPRITYHSTDAQGTAWRAAESRVVSLRRQEQSKEYEICSMEVPPSAILQPLPREEAAGLSIFFFIRMPTLFRTLTCLSFSAQQTLLPREGVDEHIERAVYVTSWLQYYSSTSTARKYTPAKTDVRLGSPKSVPKASQLQPRSVRDFSSEETGVWYPDSLVPRLYWDGGGYELDRRSGSASGCFDPFAPLPPEAVVSEFTQPLAVRDRALDWAVQQHGACAHPMRGNTTEARLDTQPSWLSKVEFLSFCAFRAYPNQQARKLCVALAERSLPLQEAAVRTLLQSAMYHLGDLDPNVADAEEPRLWRTDLASHGGWAALRCELASLADELRNKPREYGALHILGELAAHASQWDEASRAVARAFAGIVRAWADAEQEDLAPQDERPLKRARRCLFCMYGIFCHGAGPLSAGDVAELCQLVVLADYNRLFGDPTPMDAQVRALSSISLGVVARRLPELLAQVDRDTHVLTEAVRCVLQTQTPPRLDWTRVVQAGALQTCCYEAVYGAKLLFSVNLLTGVALLDGLPPSRLPASILEMPLYKRVFADTNFEVTRDGCGVLTTLRRVGGCKYTFYVDAAGELEVRESRPGLCTLELLDGLPDSEEGCADGEPDGVGCWGAELPSRLKEMHSHWYSRELDIVVLRPRPFSEPEIEFVLWPGSASGGAGAPGAMGTPVVCQRVPRHLQIEMEGRILGGGEDDDDDEEEEQQDDAEQDEGEGETGGDSDDEEDESSWAPFVWPAGQEVDRLVLLSPSIVLRVLSKFETDVEFIHGFNTRRKTLLFELPRYGLGFELRDGRLHSENFVGFALAPRQQLQHTLHGFQQYLLLESVAQDAPSLVIVPVGAVVPTADLVEVQGSSAFDAQRRYHAYEVHPRFGSIEARRGPAAIEARLQLAALYAATGTALPEAGFKKTGGEIALELLSHSWKAHPHTAAEFQQLSCLGGFSRLTPALLLLAKELHVSATELAFLHPSTDAPRPLDSQPCRAAAAEYILRKQASRSCSRALLTADEEACAVGFTVVVRPERRELPHAGSLHVSRGDEERVESELSALAEALNAMVVSSSEGGAGKAAGRFPLDATRFGETELGRSIQADLQQSWLAHRSTPVLHLASAPAALQQTLAEHQDIIWESRSELEAKVLSDVDRVPSEHHWHAPAFNMRRAANLEPRVTLRDLASAACAPTSLRAFNPFLSDEALSVLHAGILLWLRLCVAEDKLERMLAHAAAGNSLELEREARQTRRAWDVRAHPHWLVFEVEQRLQIRREQHTMARFLLDNEWTTSQLNMGEGKTRVILPMLVLELARPGSKQLVRLNFLSQLLSEAYDFLHRNLTASLACRRLVQLPFHRDAPLSTLNVRRMLAFLERCRAAGGSVVVAPEHRLSLQLKWHEARLAGNDALVAELTRLDAQLHFHDILDECDALLSHRYQLIYAIGSATPLPAGTIRWAAAQALLKALSRRDGPVYALLRRKNVSRRLSRLEARGAGSFDDVRLLPGDELERHTPDLLRALAGEVVDRCPHQLRWLAAHRQGHARDAIVRFVTDPGMSLDQFRAETGGHGDLGGALQEETLLALRGLLACGLASHCLCRRHRVDYGVDARRGHKARVAVPFRGSDAPSERAEYAQPDTLLVYTTLAYYHSGISVAQVKEALAALHSLGTSA